MGKKTLNELKCSLVGYQTDSSNNLLGIMINDDVTQSILFFKTEEWKEEIVERRLQNLRGG